MKFAGLDRRRSILNQKIITTTTIRNASQTQPPGMEGPAPTAPLHLEDGWRDGMKDPQNRERRWVPSSPFHSQDSKRKKI